VLKVKLSPREILEEHEELAVQAEKVLRQNDMGDWTRTASGLYPHQWSWASAFIAIGPAHLDVRRAACEHRTLFTHQWRTGKVPHIVFNPKAPPHSYYPGAEHWACAAVSPDAPPAPPYTIRFTAEGEAAVEAGPETVLACDAGARHAVEALSDAVCLISVATGG
jgi:hypothetical protein